jgi:hypothetical protein
MEEFYRDLSGWLPERIKMAAANYRRFTAADPSEDTKAFAAHEAACRASLAHIHLLIRLARWSESAGDPSKLDGARNLDQLFDEAEMAIKTHQFNEN